MKIKGEEDAIIFDKYTALLHNTGVALRTIRKSQGMSLSELESKVNIAKSDICDIENGNENFTMLTIVRLCHALDIEIRSLF